MAAMKISSVGMLLALSLCAQNRVGARPGIQNAFAKEIDKAFTSADASNPSAAQ